MEMTYLALRSQARTPSIPSYPRPTSLQQVRDGAPDSYPDSYHGARLVETADLIGSHNKEDGWLMATRNCRTDDDPQHLSHLFI